MTDTREIWTRAAIAEADRILWPIVFRMFWLDVALGGSIELWQHNEWGHDFACAACGLSHHADDCRLYELLYWDAIGRWGE